MLCLYDCISIIVLRGRLERSREKQYHVRAQIRYSYSVKPLRERKERAAITADVLTIDILAIFSRVLCMLLTLLKFIGAKCKVKF